MKKEADGEKGGEVTRLERFENFYGKLRPIKKNQYSRGICHFHLASSSRSSENPLTTLLP